MDHNDIPCRVSAETRQHEAGLRDVTENDLLEAARSIADDYLTCGDRYPRGAKYGYATAGDFIVAKADEDELPLLISKMVYGAEAEAGDARDALRRLCDEGLVEWLTDKRPELVDRREEEIATDRAEDAL